MFKTIAVVLVGEHFLEGEGCNIMQEILKEINNLNYLVKKVSVLHENERIVSNELNTLSKQFDIVLIVGKLSSDIIFKALANITFQDRKTNIKFQEVLTHLQEPDDCQLPVGSKLLCGKDLEYPIIQLQTIYILNEKYIEKHLNILRKRLPYYRKDAKFKKVVHFQKNGNTNNILQKINKVVSTKICQNSDADVSVTLESISFEVIVEIERLMQKELNNKFIDSYVISNILENIYTDPDEQIQKAIEVVEKCLKDYEPQNIFLSFNGGKDCTVLLHLIHSVLLAKYPDYKRPIICLYVKSERAFPEQDEFILQCQTYYNLEVITVTQSIKEALNKILSVRPNLKACFMGTRRTDPYCSDLKTFQMTDHNWPQVMRVSPLLDWHYSNIWDYLLFYKVPYCKLYDMGYTSLGDAKNTIRNPSLLYNDIYSGTEVYLPAYKMLNENKERSGRDI